MGPQNDDEFRQYGNNLGLIGAGLALMSPRSQGGGIQGAFRGYMGAQQQAMQMARAEQQRRYQDEQQRILRERLGMDRETHQSALEKADLELKELRERLKRGSSITAEIQRMRAGAQGGLQTPAEGFGDPDMGVDLTGVVAGRPGAVSQAPGMTLPQPGQQPAMRTDSGPGQGLSSRNARGARYEQLMQEADIFDKYGDIDGANKRREAAVKLAPKLQSQKVVIHPATGKPVFLNTYEDGSNEFVDVARPVEKRSFQTFGGAARQFDDYTGNQVGADIPITMTEAQRRSDEVARGNLSVAQGGLAQRRIEHGLAVENAKRGRNVYDPDRGGVVNLDTGAFTPGRNAIDGTPIVQKDKPLGEGAQKQLLGARNLRDAVAAYREALKTWDSPKLLSPDARAAMGTAYQNVLLQGKEAYNLGVLNGPDYEVLQQVIQNPLDFKSALTSTGAKDKQAQVLDNVASSMEQHITGANPRANVPAAPATALNPAGQTPPSATPRNDAGRTVQGRQFKTLPPANSVPSGSRIRNDQTGEIMVSDGATWKKVPQ